MFCLVLKIILACCLIVGILLVISRLIGYMVIYIGFSKRMDPKEDQKDYSFVTENNIRMKESFIGEGDSRRRTYLFQANNKDLVIFSMGYGYKS